MIRRVTNFLYGTTPAAFESSFPIEESVNRLKSACKTSAFKAMFSQEAVGYVSESEVRLQRVIPFIRNSFKPFFFGSFQQIGGKVILSGKFTMHPLAKGFFSLWFGFISLVTITTVIYAPRSHENWRLGFFGIGMLLAGYALVITGKWFARNDITWLSARITKALS